MTEYSAAGQDGHSSLTRAITSFGGVELFWNVGWTLASPGIVLPAFLAAALAFYSTAFLFRLGPWGVPYAVRGYIVYFALGVIASDLQVATRLRQAKPPILVAAALIGYLLVFGGVWLGGHTTLVTTPTFAILGIGATVALAVLLERVEAPRCVAQWGNASLEIYVAHVLTSSAVRIALQKFLGYEQVTIHLMVGLLSAIYGPIFLKWAAERIGFKYLFSLRRV